MLWAAILIKMISEKVTLNKHLMNMKEEAIQISKSLILQIGDFFFLEYKLDKMEILLLWRAGRIWPSHLNYANIPRMLWSNNTTQILGVAAWNPFGRKPVRSPIAAVVVFPHLRHVKRQPVVPSTGFWAHTLFPSTQVPEVNPVVTVDLSRSGLSP